MSRISPNHMFDGLPCSMVSVGCALGDGGRELVSRAVGLKGDGYLTLENMNKYVRANLSVRKKEYFKRGERPLLVDFLKDNKDKAIVCLLGHYVYVDGSDYYSFFKNEYDPIVCIWWLK